MRYILNDSGYIQTISFNYQIECNNKSCIEYTGQVPTGYESLVEWSELANINAYKIVDGNLTFDSTEDARLQELWASQQSQSLERITLNMVYPVGSIYMSVNSTNPSILFGGTWERISQGRFLIGVKENHDYQENNIPDFGETMGMKGYLFNAEDKGGEYNNKLDFPNYQYNVWSGVQQNENNNVSRSWEPSGSYYGLGLVYQSNKNEPHNNIPPYFAVYMWKRIS